MYIRLVHLRNNRIVRLDAETVASFASSHAKRDVELLSESSITRAYHAAISRANTSNNNQGTGLQSGKRSDHCCPSCTAHIVSERLYSRPSESILLMLWFVTTNLYTCDVLLLSLAYKQKDISSSSQYPIISSKHGQWTSSIIHMVKPMRMPGQALTSIGDFAL
jgi:hypothetical protein